MSSSTNFTNSKSEDATTELQSFQQTLDLNWNRSISSALRYRVSFRADDTRNDLAVDSDVTRTSATRLEPILDASLSGGPFSLTGGIRFRELLTDGNKEDRIWLSERRWFTRLFLTPENLPTFSFQVDGFTQENDLNPKTVDKTETRYQFMTDYRYKDANFSYLFSKLINENFISGQTRDQMNHLASVNYTGNNFLGWLDVLGGYSINYTPVREDFSGGGVAELERTLSRGLRAAADLTPDDSSDVPLTNEPSLINGTALIPLEQNISLGFELVVSDPISQIRLDLSPEPPFTLPSNLNSFLEFRVFFTNDTTLTTWTELGGVTRRFDPLESRVELNFPMTTARFFKIYVSRNDFGTLIRATRISAFNLEPIGGATTRKRSTLLHTWNGTLTVRPPTRPLTISTISYDFYLSHLTQTQESNSQHNFNGTHTARIVAEPHRYLTSTFVYQHTFASSDQSGAKDTTFDLFNLVLSSTPLPTLTTSLSFGHNDNRGNGKLENRTDSSTLNVSARVYRDLNLDGTYTIARTQDFENDVKTFSQGGTLDANAWLTPRLNTRLNYALRWAQTDSPEGQTSQLTNTVSGFLNYTISRFLNTSVRYDLLFGQDTTSFTQTYNLDWSPTSKLSALIGYRRNQQDSGGERTGSDSVNFNARWNLSRYFNLDGNLIFFRRFDGNRVYSISGRVQFRF